MKELTKHQKELADKAVTILHKLQNIGVEIMVIEGGGGNNGLTFWRPTRDERIDAYDIVSDTCDPRYEEFEDKSYYPSASIGLRVDIIVP